MNTQPFTARYAGTTCCNCNVVIEVGQTIVRHTGLFQGKQAYSHNSCPVVTDEILDARSAEMDLSPSYGTPEWDAEQEMRWEAEMIAREEEEYYLEMRDAEAEYRELGWL